MVEQTTQTAGPALARLREVTAVAHQSLEIAIRFMDADLTRYRELITDFFGFYEPLEQQAACYFQPGWLDDADRRKAPLLKADLGSLGYSEPAIANLPRCGQLPTVTGEAEQLGCMYVVEGSTLGGQHISRRLFPVLGLTPDRGGRFYTSYGQHVGLRWREFRKHLEIRLQTDAMRDEAAGNAFQTFEKLKQWLTRRNRPAIPNVE